MVMWDHTWWLVMVFNFIWVATIWPCMHAATMLPTYPVRTWPPLIGTRQAFPPTAVLLWVIHRWLRHLNCMANLCYHLAAHTPLVIDGEEDIDLYKYYLYCSKLTQPWRPLKLKSRWLCCCAEGCIHKAQSNLIRKTQFFLSCLTFLRYT